ncbi:MAG: hypothetical protein ABI948_10265 [Thermoleophilia bacterium]
MRLRSLVPVVAVLACALLWTAAPAAAVTPVTWCGNDRVATNRVPNVDTGSPYNIHVIYAIPSDGADRFGSFTSPIATDISAMDGWWRSQDAARTPRFDLFAFAGCTTHFGDLDIGFARLPRPGSAYAGFNLLQLSADLTAFAPPNVKNVVYYDGPTDDPNVCGTTGYLATRQGGQFGFAFVWLRSDCDVDVGTGNLTAEVAVHELVHNLGAVPTGAPHECAAPNDGHVCDSTADLLYPFVTSGASLTTEFLDVGRDDYYGHSGSWWDVQDSDWLMHLPLFTLTAAVAGGTGIVASDVGGLSCPPSCSVSLENGVKATLTAQPAAGQRFVAWSGACTGAGPCVVTMDAAKSVSATFAAATVPLAVRVTGRGVVRSSPAGIVCSSSCSHAFAAGSTVRLTAKASKGYRFSGWSGACRGTKPCAVKLDSAKSARATFRKRS